jgi:hypothetical protein
MAPLEELDDSTKGLEGWHRAGLLCKLFVYQKIKGVGFWTSWKYVEVFS